VFESLQKDSAGFSPFAAGLTAGFISGYLSSPFARARTVLQTFGDAAAAAGITTWRSVIFGRGAFAAAPSWAARTAGHTAVIFTLFEHEKTRLEATFPAASPTLLHLAASAHAACVSCVLLNPIDLACTRYFYQSAESAASAGAGAAASAPRYASPLDAARQVVVAEGALGLYRGLGANLLRVVPHTAATFALLHMLRGAGGWLHARAPELRSLRGRPERPSFTALESCSPM